MQWTRRFLQAAFLGLTLVAVFIAAGNAERWCPFGGVEALYTYLSEGNMTCSLAVSNFFILAGILVSVLLLRRAFCGYACPIGAISEWLGLFAAKLGLRPLRVPQRVEAALALLKYGVLALILWLTWSAGELLFRAADPCYALISRHGEDITFWAYVVSGAILAGALFTAVPFCRWFCPLAAVFNPLSRFGLMRIQRDATSCSECGQCSAECPMNIPVADLHSVEAARCTACLQCVSSCPTAGEGTLALGPPGRVWRHPHLAVAAVFLALLSTSVAASYLFPLPSFIKERPGISPPSRSAVLDLNIRGVKCRGTSTALYFFLTRDDLFEIPGYLKLETWPAPIPQFARVRITYDPARTDRPAIEEAIVTPYFDEAQSFERLSPFEIEGYAPWDDL